jgi:hypothetical protein
MTPRIAAVTETPDGDCAGAADFAAVLSLMVETPLRTFLAGSLAAEAVCAV